MSECFRNGIAKADFQFRVAQIAWIWILSELTIYVLHIHVLKITTSAKVRVRDIQFNTKFQNYKLSQHGDHSGGRGRRKAQWSAKVKCCSNLTHCQCFPHIETILYPPPQSAFTCSKLTIEILDQGVKHVQS